MTTLTLTHLRFTCEAITPVDLPAYRAGSQLRGALGNVMRRAYCPEAHFGAGRSPTLEHTSVCPVCWLMTANEHPGEERRGYALQPPVVYHGRSPDGPYAPGERFDFGLTLYGDTLRLLPYFLLTVAEVGREGVGIGRGRFELRQVHATDPLGSPSRNPQGVRQECVLAEGDALVRVPTLRVDVAGVAAAADALAARLTAAGTTGAGRLRLRFVTPTRLVANGQLVKAPDFGVLFARLLERIDQLERQYAGGERSPAGGGAPMSGSPPADGRRDETERQALLACGDRVRLADSRTQWVEVRSGSTRRNEPTWISGFVGEAVYTAPPEVWRPLLPWLVWGQVIQVGKDVVKGNGVYVISE
jgi:hypothetical protein